MADGRYLRHSLIDWFDQEKLGNAEVLVVGAGATGNEVLKNLALLGVGHMHIVDFDAVEDHNLTRSVLFREKDIGRNKAETAAEACRQIDPSCSVTWDSRDLWDALSIDRLRRCSALFCCVDNYEARIRLNELCLWASVDLYNVGIDSRFVCVERYPFGSHHQCPCYQCCLPPSAYRAIRERYSCAWLRKKAWDEKKIPTTAITASSAGALACSLFLQKGHAHCPSGAVRVLLDTIGFTSTVVSLEQNPECWCTAVQPDHHYFKVTRGPGSQAMAGQVIGDDQPVYLSDRLVLEVKCATCGAERTLNDRADRYDESLEICTTCNEKSNEVTIRDMMTAGELAGRFIDRPLPLKYFYFMRDGVQIIMEMEEHHERADGYRKDSRQVEKG